MTGMKKVWVVLLCVLASNAGAADYIVRPSEGNNATCVQSTKDGKQLKRMSGARFCHNCQKTGGNAVVWKFTVYCDNKPTDKNIMVRLPCKKSIPDEGEQRRSLVQKAHEIMEDRLSIFDDLWCDHGDW